MSTDNTGQKKEYKDKKNIITYKLNLIYQCQHCDSAQSLISSLPIVLVTYYFSSIKQLSRQTKT